jgi:hypothetical protein
MTNTKMTKKDRFTKLLTYEEVKADKEMVEFIEHEIELLIKKNAGKSKAAEKNAEANAKMIAEILEVLTKPMTATEIAKAIQPNYEMDISNQRVSALMRKLTPKTGSGEVTKEVIKGKTYFSKVEG